MERYYTLFQSDTTARYKENILIKSLNTTSETHYGPYNQASVKSVSNSKNGQAKIRKHTGL